MNKDKIERISLISLFILVVYGLFLAVTAPDVFTNVYAREDGFVENLTSLFAFLSALILLYRLFTLAKKGALFYVTTIVMVLGFIFIAGEEISWGQRIFDIESPKIFLEKNAQEETNLHNMTVNGVKINKLIFGKLLTIIIFIYLVGFSFAYRKYATFKSLVDKWVIPIPFWYQTIAFILGALMTLVVDVPRSSEVLELVATVVFFCIILKPYNEHIYKRDEVAT